MVTRTVDTEHDRSMLIRFIEGHKVPFIAELTAGKRRSIEQNKLQRKWMTEISEQLGDRTPEEVRAYCKLTIGVPLLREENETFREKYDAVVRPMPYEQKIAIMSEPLDMPVTRLMTSRQKHAYLDAIFQHFSEKGIVLTIPPDKRFGPPIEQEPSSPAVPPATDGGSGDSSPPVPAADQSASSSQESGTAGGNSGDEPEKPSADEVAMVNTAKSNVEGIKADMVKMLVRLAGENLTAQERLETLDGAYPLWVEQMPGHPTLVKQCFDTAKKVINGELPAAAARKFMESITT